MHPTGDYLLRLHSAALDEAESLRFDKTDTLQFTLVTLYGSLVELAGCILVLCRYDGYAGLGSVTRTMLEAYVDFVNLCDDADYIRYIDAADAKQLKSILSAARDGKNRFLTGASESELFKPSLARIEEEMEALAAEGIKPLQIFQKFELAGMRELYDSVYALLCSDTHSNRNALLGRHLERLGTGFNVGYYLPRTDEDLLPFFDSAAGMLHDATRRIHEFFGVETSVELQTLLDELVVIREGYASEA